MPSLVNPFQHASRASVRGRLEPENQKIRLAIFTTHPIQYQAPWFRALAQSQLLEPTVFFAYRPNAVEQGIGFGVPLQWDVPLLDGYLWRELPGKSWLFVRRAFFRHPYARLFSTLKRTRPDVALVLGWNEVSLIQALICCKILRIPLIIRGESNALRKRPWYVRQLHRWLFSLCDAFLAIGQANQQLFLDNDVRPERIFMARYFVENTRFFEQSQCLTQSRSRLREKFGVPEKCCCFCFVGKLQPKKRVLDFLIALRMSAVAGAHVHGLIVGTGEQLDEARRYSSLYSLPVHYAGFLNQTEIAEAYMACDVLVLPSDYGETWGLVVNEAMACGRPALVSDRVGCGPDLIVESETGSIFPFGKTEILSQRMIEWSLNPEMVRRMGSVAQKRVCEQFSVERAVEETLTAVLSVVRTIVAQSR